jgi:hypothetical protein
VVFAGALAAIVGASVWRLDTRGLARHREDQLIHQMSQWRGVQAEAVVLADSVTAGAAYPAEPAPGVYPLLTNGYLRMIGQYLTLRRFLEHNSTREAYVFMLPALLVQDVSDDEGGGLARYTYIDTVFTRADEKAILGEAGASPRAWRISFFDRLLKAWYPNRTGNPFTASLSRVDPASAGGLPAADTAPRVSPRLTAQVRHVLGRFAQLCTVREVRCVFIQEPTIPGSERFDMRELGAMFPALTFVDVHDYATFPREAFFDHLHLERQWARRYVALIQANIAPLFATGTRPWDGARVAFNSAEGLSRFTSDAYHNAEAWGTWTSSPQTSLRFVPASTFDGGQLRIGLAVAPDPRTPMKPVAIFLNGQRVWSGEGRADGVVREISFALPAGAISGRATAELRIDVPSAVRPRDAGLGNDDRELAVGLGYIAYCSLAHPCN